MQASPTIQEIEERISTAEDTIENIDTTKKIQKQKASNPKHPGNLGHNEKTKLRITGIE